MPGIPSLEVFVFSCLENETKQKLCLYAHFCFFNLGTNMHVYVVFLSIISLLFVKYKLYLCEMSLHIERPLCLTSIYRLLISPFAAPHSSWNPHCHAFCNTVAHFLIVILLSLTIGVFSKLIGTIDLEENWRDPNISRSSQMTKVMVMTTASLLRGLWAKEQSLGAGSTPELAEWPLANLIISVAFVSHL